MLLIFRKPGMIRAEGIRTDSPLNRRGCRVLRISSFFLRADRCYGRKHRLLNELRRKHGVAYGHGVRELR